MSEGRESIKNIEFKVKSDHTVFEDGITPWANIGYAEDDIADLIDGDELVIAETEVSVKIDYPLASPYIFSLKSDTGFTRASLLLAISAKYQQIFEEDEKSINDENPTGKYGVWGHEIGELDLSLIEVYKTNSGKIELELWIES